MNLFCILEAMPYKYLKSDAKVLQDIEFLIFSMLMNLFQAAVAVEQNLANVQAW